jgi:hypothetical protein
MSSNTAASLGFGLVGAAVAGPVGWAVGAAIGGALFPPQLPDQNQQKLDNLRIGNASYGKTIPIVYGTCRVATTLLWTTGRKAKKHKEESGGKGGPSQTTTYYTYSLEIEGVRKIWINGRLMWDKSKAKNKLNLEGSNNLADSVTIYTGSETQEPSSLQEAKKGVGNVPAYRGLAYIEFEKLQLEKFGNGMVNVEVEVVKLGSTASGPTIVHELDVRRPISGTLTDGALGVYDQGTVIWGSAFSNSDLEFSYTITRTDLFSNPIEVNTYSDTHVFTGAGGTDAGFCKNDPYFLWWDKPAEPGTWGRLYWFKYPIGLEGYLRAEAAISQSAIYHCGVDDHNLYHRGGDKDTIRFGDLFYFTCAPVTGGAQNEALIKYRIDASTLAPTIDALDCSNLGTDKTLWSDASSTATITNGRLWHDAKNTHEYFFLRRTGTIVSENSFVMMDGDWNIITKWDTSVGGANPISNLTEGSLVSSDGWLMRKNVNFPLALYSFDPFVDNGPFTLVGTLTDPYGNDWGELLPITPTWAMGRDHLFSVEGYISAGAVTVRSIVEDQLDRVGIASTEVDATGNTKSIAGYLINQNQSARGAIETLQPIGFFDVAEVDGKLITTERGGAAFKTIPQDDLAARIDNRNTDVDDMEISRASEYELPRSISLTYINPDDEYETNTQLVERLTVQGEGVQNAQMPVVLQDETAMTIADTMLYTHYAEREKITLTLSTKHLDLAPNDVITLGDSGYRVRVDDVTQDIVGVITVQGTIEAADTIYTSVRDLAYVSTTSDVEGFPGPTLYKMMALPMLRDADDRTGFYLVLYGPLEDWEGANLYSSSDNTDYQPIFTLLTEGKTGFASTALASANNDTTWDWSNTFNVRMHDSNVLQTDTELNVLNGANALAVGREDVYRLSQLLRGRRGTEHATDTHVDGEDVVVLQDDGSVVFVDTAYSDIDVTKFFKGVSIGNFIQYTDPKTFAHSGETLKPHSPVLIRGTRDSDNDVHFTWVRRSRYDYTPDYQVFLDQDNEVYDVDFYDSASTLLRTVSSITEASVAYASTDRAADGASAAEVITANVFQVADDIGRGYPGTGTA